MDGLGLMSDGRDVIATHHHVTEEFGAHGEMAYKVHPFAVFRTPLNVV
jgi:hypothetical protein